MAGPTFARKQKQLEAEPSRVPLEVVPQKKEVEALRRQLNDLERDYQYLQRKLDNTRVAYRDELRFESFILGKEPKDDEFLAMLMNQGLGKEKPIIAEAERLSKHGAELEQRLNAAGMHHFMDELSYKKVFNVIFGYNTQWSAKIETAMGMHASWQKYEKARGEAIEATSYATIGPQQGPAVPGWARPALELPRAGKSLLMHPGEKLYVGEGGRVVPESALRIERELERRGTRTPRGVEVRMSFEEFSNLFVPVLPFIDAAVTDVKVMWKEGVSWKGAGSITLNLAMAGLDVVLIGQLATRSIARTTGRELAGSLWKNESRFAMSRAERDVLDTAIRELKPGELKDLFRIARPAQGPGLGWLRVFEDLALKAGDKEITGDIMRAYLKEQTSASRLGRAAWKLKAGTLDFFENGLSFFSRKRFGEKVAAELFNELRMAIDPRATKRLGNLLVASGMPQHSRRLASDAMMYALTSFSQKPQRALLRLVEKEGWPVVVAKLRREGVQDGLARILPEYAAAFREAPLHRLFEYGIGRVGISVAFIALEPQVRAVAESLFAEPGRSDAVVTPEDALRRYFETHDEFVKKKSMKK